MRRRFASMLICAAAFAAGAPGAHAAVTFKAPVSYGAAAGTHDVAIGDVNKDGKKDLITANGSGQSFSVLLGNGDGTFGSASTISIGKTPETVDVYDFDADGNPDVAISLPDDNQVIVYWGAGTSTPYSALSTTTISTPNHPLDAVGLDLNADGKGDIVTANYGAQSIQAFLYSGTRTFTAGAAPLVGNGPNTLAAGAVFTSGDIMVTNRDGGNMRAMPGDGAGGFQVGSTYGVGRVTPDDSGLGAPTAVAIGDINGDGRNDAVTSNGGTNSATALYNTGSGFFTIQQNTVMPTGAAPSGIATGDFTGDGRADAAVVDGGTDAVTVTQFGGGTNVPMSTVGTYPAGSGLTRDAAADFNGDGAADLAIASTSNGGEVHILMSRGTPTAAGQASASVAVGGSLTDDVTLAGGTPNAGGSISWNLYAPGDTTCSATIAHEVLAVSGMGTYTTPLPMVSAHAGTYRWVASYSGDTNNAAVTGTCADANQTTVVTKAATSATATALSGITIGDDVPASASLSGGHSPTGTLSISAYTTADCSGSPAYTSDPITVTGNTTYPATPTFTPSTAGTYRWQATYSGDADNQAATSTCGAANSVTDVAQASTSLSASATGPVTVGHTLPISATLSGGHSPIGGTITFTAYTSATCTGTPVWTGTATVSGTGPYQPSPVFTPSSAGTYHVLAGYGGDANNLASASACGDAVTVEQATPSVGVTVPSTIGLGDDDAAQADLSGSYAGGGSVTFRAYANDTCTGTAAYTSSAVSVSGDGGYAAAPVFTPTHAGAYHWTASYSGDANNASAASSCGASGSVTTVSPFTPTVTGTATSGTLGTAVHDTATLAGTTAHAGGTLTFRAFTTGGCTGTPAFTSTPVAVDGDGQYGSGAFTPNAPGEYRWTIAYSGDGDNAPASTLCGTAGQTSTITQATLKLSPTALHFGKVAVGNPVQRTVTVTNSSAGATAEPATLGTLSVAGTGYRFVANACSTATLAPGASCTFTVAFDPAVAGAATGSVTIPSNAAGSPATVGLDGTGVAVPVSVSVVGVTRCLGTGPGAKSRVTIAYTVSQPARMTFTLQRRVKPGGATRTSCPKALPAAVPGDYVNVRRPANSARGVARAAAATTVLSKTVSVTAGAHTFKLSSLLGGATLKPGRYRVRIQAATVQGATTQTAAYFWVLKPKKAPKA